MVVPKMTHGISSETKALLHSACVLLLVFSTDSQKLQWHLCGFPLGLPGIADPSVRLAGLQPLG